MCWCKSGFEYTVLCFVYLSVFEWLEQNQLSCPIPTACLNASRTRASTACSIPDTGHIAGPRLVLLPPICGLAHRPRSRPFGLAQVNARLPAEHPRAPAVHRPNALCAAVVRVRRARTVLVGWSWRRRGGRGRGCGRRGAGRLWPAGKREALAVRSAVERTATVWEPGVDVERLPSRGGDPVEPVSVRLPLGLCRDTGVHLARPGAVAEARVDPPAVLTRVEHDLQLVQKGLPVADRTRHLLRGLPSGLEDVLELPRIEAPVDHEGRGLELARHVGGHEAEMRGVGVLGLARRSEPSLRPKRQVLHRVKVPHPLGVVGRGPGVAHGWELGPPGYPLVWRKLSWSRKKPTLGCAVTRAAGPAAARTRSAIRSAWRNVASPPADTPATTTSVVEPSPCAAAQSRAPSRFLIPHIQILAEAFGTVTSERFARCRSDSLDVARLNNSTLPSVHVGVDADPGCRGGSQDSV
eukprot:m.311797 g.311797  ORF g.311797 m.311797 type:complete len:466 (+) comp16391_c0_seq1:359-1756(+)